MNAVHFCDSSSKLAVGRHPARECDLRQPRLLDSTPHTVEEHIDYGRLKRGRDVLIWGPIGSHRVGTHGRLKAGE